ncbi:MAG TPA: DUF3710 domain-containing protein [Streptosporangiaceae bacterium]
MFRRFRRDRSEDPAETRLPTEDYDAEVADSGVGSAGEYTAEDDGDYQAAEDYAAEDYAAEDYAAEEGWSTAGDAGSGARLAAAEPDDLAAAEPSRRERADLSDPATWTRLRDTTQPDLAGAAPAAGPWDSASGYPDQARMDFGSLLVPVKDGYDIQVMMSEEEGISVAVVHGDSGMQLQPFAAPRNAGLWHEVLPEIAQEVAKAGGQSAERDGPFGAELVARVAPQGGGAKVAPQPLRFIGVDGPRWFLRGLISGPAALDDQQTQQFREILSDVVVVRGEQAQPPRQPLQIQLPAEARQAMESETAGQQPDPLNPFERGPEITETR